jgi:hypothetical protein
MVDAAAAAPISRSLTTILGSDWMIGERSSQHLSGQEDPEDSC